MNRTFFDYNRTFFDYIGAADMERIHSATIAWMVSDNCRALAIEDRTNILNTLFKTDKNDLTSIEAINEFEHLDIVFITTDNCGQKELWILENKVKAPLAYDQLKKYTQKIKEGYKKDNSKRVNAMIECIDRYRNKFAHTHFAVLSLIGLLPQDDKGDWQESTYKELSDLLDSICAGKGNTEQMAIINEYCKCISTLVKAQMEFSKNPRAYPNVFTDGNKSKAFKTTLNQPDVMGYLANNGLETLCQKKYFADIVKEIAESGKITFTDCHVGESRGNADLAFHFEPFGQDKTYLFDLSFQYGAFKLAVCKERYPSLTDSLKRELEIWEKAFEEIKKTNKYPRYNRINSPRGKARLSISYNIGNDWYKKYDSEAFINLIIDQVHIARQMAREITEIRESILKISNWKECFLLRPYLCRRTKNYKLCHTHLK